MHDLNKFGNFRGYQGKIYAFKTFPFLCFLVRLFHCEHLRNHFHIRPRRSGSLHSASSGVPERGAKNWSTYRAIEVALQVTYRIFLRQQLKSWLFEWMCYLFIYLFIYFSVYILDLKFNWMIRFTCNYVFSFAPGKISSIVYQYRSHVQSSLAAWDIP